MLLLSLKEKQMTTKKKKTVIDYRQVSEEFAAAVDDALFQLFELKDMALNGEITNKDLIHDLFAICHKLENTMNKYEKGTGEN
jgi:hypothetical protein